MCPTRSTWRRGHVGMSPTDANLATQLDVGIGTACDPGCGQPTVERRDKVLASACATTRDWAVPETSAGVLLVMIAGLAGTRGGASLVCITWGHGDADRGHGPRARWSQRSTDRSSRDLRDEPAMSTRSHRRPALTVQATLVVRPPGTSRYALPRPPSPAQMRRSVRGAGSPGRPSCARVRTRRCGAAGPMHVG
jgi:hypothetical protein